MKIKQLSVQNYKSLREIHLSPGPLNVVVGANAAGKSNLADCFDFISEVYRHGLEVAVARKGGYENIAFRKMRRSRGAISIDLLVELTETDYEQFLPKRLLPDDLPRITVRHAFSFVTKGYSIRAEFQVVTETLVVERSYPGQPPVVALQLARSENQVSLLHLAPIESESKRAELIRLRRYFDFNDVKYFVEHKEAVSPNELFAVSVGRFVAGLRPFREAVERMRVFQISAPKSRKFGVPTPRPELARTGENLPAVIDLLKKESKEWRSVLTAMRAILPNLKDINVDYTSNRTLGLFFEEEGFGRPWSVDEVSDGTIQTLALLVAIFDTRSTALILEEPENSVHPWIVRHVVEACRTASEHKQLFVTTHSPIVMNAVRPEEVWVIWRADGESHLAPLVALEPGFRTMWEKGSIPTFDFIDSGALTQALPPPPSIAPLDDAEE